MAEPESREDNIYFARLSEQGERYEDMIRYMKNVANVSCYFLFLNHFVLFTVVWSKFH